MNKDFTKLFFIAILFLFTINTTAQTNFTMNEVYSRGTSAEPDWIEIYNLTSSVVDISGYKIYDSGGQSGTKPKKEFATGTTISANGFLVVVTEDGTESAFGLSSNGETVWIEDALGVVVDSVVFPALQTTESYSRVPDGESWVITNFITKGTSNNPINPAAIVMNEIYSRGTTTEPDWIELYNPFSTDVDISGYKIYDSGGQSGTKPKKEFATGTTISANGFLVIVTDDTLESGFGLSSNGETVWIEDATGFVVDSVVFPALQTTESYSRVPDGENWVVTNSITKGTTNIYSNPTAIVMNEIYSRGTTAEPDWIELYNPFSEEVNISGYKIYDGGGFAGTKPKKEFAIGTTISAFGFLVVVTDDTLESGFGLSSNGEEVWLEDANGFVLDDVTFPTMDSAQSYIRYPDGSSPWQLTTEITKGFANVITEVDEKTVVVNHFKLEQNYPNPFNPNTTIRYTIPTSSFVTLKVFDVLGNEIATLVNEMKSPGHYQLTFDGKGLSSGVYFYQINAGNFITTKKFILAK